jgi:hypothetical protein
VNGVGALLIESEFIHGTHCMVRLKCLTIVVVIWVLSMLLTEI